MPDILENRHHRLYTYDRHRIAQIKYLLKTVLIKIIDYYNFHENSLIWRRAPQIKNKKHSETFLLKFFKSVAQCMFMYFLNTRTFKDMACGGSHGLRCCDTKWGQRSTLKLFHNRDHSNVLICLVNPQNKTSIYRTTGNIINESHY